MENTIATRYAKALLAHTQKKKLTPTIAQDIQDFLDLYEQTPQLANFLNNPSCGSTFQENLFKRHIAPLYHKITSQFISIIIRYHRAPLLIDIVKSFLTLTKQHQKRQEVKVTVAQELDQSTMDEIVVVAQKIFHIPKMVPTIEVDPTMLGGYILQVGDRYLDASIRRRLRHLSYIWQKTV